MKGAPWTFLKDLAAMNLGRGRLFRVILMLTRQCPLQCKTCGIWKNNGSDPGPALEEIASFFEKNQFSWINLTGGEIFFRKDLPELFGLLAKTQKKL
ncbi:MAG: 4Fe-4S cluster-binding domain-containing protein, partial [Planctomycetes bacterium]|nr:4Fe-4S cluster-binding domain-containing protein [Planctomycetota bacterium]